MIKDLTGAELPSVTVGINPPAIYQFQILVDCLTDKWLYADEADDLTIEGKHVASGTWVNLFSTGINLSPWDSEDEVFDIRISSTAPTEIYQRNFGLFVL